MNVMDLSDIVQIKSAVEAGLEFVCDFQLSACPRLRVCHPEITGSGHVRIQLARDERQRILLTGEGHVQYRLNCQRCLEGIDCELLFPIALLLSADEVAIEQLPAGFETYIITEPVFTPLEIIENELLVAIPDWVKHPEQNCNPALLAHIEERNQRNPFAVLQQLKTSMSS